MGLLFAFALIIVLALTQKSKVEEDRYWYRVSGEIEAINANTNKRFKAYIAFNKALDGTVSYFLMTMN